MKKLFTIILIAVMFSLTAFNYVTENTKATATVEQKQGLYIFILSKPTTEYNYLGSVKKNVAWSGKPEEMLNSMIKKMLKEYPKADAIIFTNLQMDMADAIQFK